MTSKIFLILISFSLCNEVLARQVVGSRSRELVNQTKINLKTNYSQYGNDLEGSPYINEEFVKIKLNDKDVVYFGRYNAYTEVMEIKSSNQNIFEINSNVDCTVELLEDSFKTYKSNSDNFGNTFFSVVHWEGNSGYGIYSKEEIEFINRQETTGYDSSPKRIEFKRKKDILYIRFPENKQLIKIPKKKKSFYSLFKDGNIKEKLVKEKIDFKNISSLISFFKENEGIL